MIDINLIRDNSELVKENIKKKFQENKLPLVDKVKKLDEEWREIKHKEDDLRSQRNKISREISESKKAKDDSKAEKLMNEAKKIPGKIAKFEEDRKKLGEEIKEIMYKIPNIIHKSVPIGKNENENVEIEKIGEPRKVDFEILNHAELAEKLGGVDFEIAREVSGNGFYYLRGDLALLSSAMTSFARDHMVKNGFEYIEPPLMIRKKVVEGVMSFEEIKAMMYKIEDEDLYLIATSEFPLIGMFMDKNLKASNLPYTMTGFSPCFRKEVGAHGIEEKGFYRLHQFNKQEMVVVCDPKDSHDWYDKMLKFSVDVFKALDIPVRVLECCSGDLADLKAKSCDLEAWSPRQKKYFEVCSLTNMEEGQSRRLNIKIEDKGKKYFAHTLNNTVLATPRALIALMENNQQKDGSIKIPEALQKYMDGKKVIEIKK
jgi:seryl-tRNA synthetase